MPLINCEVNFILTWSANCVIVSTDVANQNTTFTITEAKRYVPVVTLLTQDDAKLLMQLKSGFKRTIYWNKYLSKPVLLAQNQKCFELLARNCKSFVKFNFIQYKMTQYNSLIIKLSNSQLNELKSAIKNE